MKHSELWHDWMRIKDALDCIGDDLEDIRRVFTWRLKFQFKRLLCRLRGHHWRRSTTVGAEVTICNPGERWFTATKVFCKRCGEERRAP